MTKSIFELDKSDVEQYMADKGIKDCSLCQSKNTLEPVYDDELKAVYKQSCFLEYKHGTLEHGMNSFEVLVTCSHCGAIHFIAPGNIASHFDLNT